MKTSNKIFSFGFLVSILFTIGTLIFVKGNMVPTESITGEGEVISETRTFAKFDKINTGGSFSVKLHYGEPAITVSSYKNIMDKIVTDVKDGILYIGLEPGSYNNALNNTVVHVTTRDLKKIDVGSAGSVMSRDTFDLEKIDLHVSGSAALIMILNATDINVNLSSAGNMELTGKATNLIGNISGSADLTAHSLDVENATMEVSSAGTARIKANHINKAHVSGSGNLLYIGNPTINDLDISSAGKIRQQD